MDIQNPRPLCQLHGSNHLCCQWMPGNHTLQKTHNTCTYTCSHIQPTQKGLKLDSFWDKPFAFAASAPTTMIQTYAKNQFQGLVACGHTPEKLIPIFTWTENSMTCSLRHREIHSDKTPLQEQHPKKFCSFTCNIIQKIPPNY